MTSVTLTFTFDDMAQAERALAAVRQAIAETPKTATRSPLKQAAEAVSERTAIVVAPVTGVAEAGGLGQPETIPALTGQFPGANVSGPERAGVTAGETANPFAKIRPFCQHPDACAGYGRNHCFSCGKIAAAEESIAPLGNISTTQVPR